MTDVAIVYVTTPDAATAEAIGTALVEAGLAACANIVPGLRSIYRWRGAVERADETLLLLKTATDRVDAVFAAVRERHPYEVPALLALSPGTVDASFARWIVEASGGPDPGGPHAP